MGANLTNPIEISTGKVQGYYEEDEKIAVFNGIPYAEAPVGNLRWKPPVAPKSWSGVRNAEKHGMMPMQLGVGIKEFFSTLIGGIGWSPIKQFFIKVLFNFMPAPKEDEDCLFVNVRTPALNSGKKLPVMVWIHGGDHQDGSGADIYYLSNKLALRDTVFVSINYRLGLMGYFTHPELNEESDHGVSGNYGTLDQIAALKWVQKNIEAFGGDPDNVTIFGQSAGGESVAHMVTSPLAKGLFHKAILQSPCNSQQLGFLKKPFLFFNASVDNGVNFANEFAPQGPGQIEKLRGLSAKELYKVFRKNPKHQVFYPMIDGYVLEKSPFQAFADGDVADVPIMVGSTSDEGSLTQHIVKAPFMDYRFHNPGPEEFPAVMEKEFGKEGARRLFKLYPGLKTMEHKAIVDFYGDYSFGSKAYFYAQQLAKQDRPVYFYFFTQPPPSKTQTIGAFHAADVPFVHGIGTPIIPLEGDDIKLAEKIGDYWVNFAKTGNPNCKHLPKWPIFTKNNEACQELKSDIETIGVPRKDIYDIQLSRLEGQIERMRVMEKDKVGI